MINLNPNAILATIRARIDQAMQMRMNPQARAARPPVDVQTAQPATFSEIFDNINPEINAAIRAASAEHGVDETLIRAIIRAESSYNPLAISHAGAIGLMQLMPATAQSLGVTNPFDIAQNIDGGTRYIASLLARFDGDVELALAAYNAGWPRVEQHGGIPPIAETEVFVPRVLGFKQEYLMAQYAANDSLRRR